MTDPSIEQVKVPQEAAHLISTIMTSAFMEYPPMRYVLGGSKTYETDLSAIQKFYLDIFVQHDWPIVVCREEARVKAVALLTPPGASESKSTMDRLLGKLKDEIGETSFERLVYYEEESEALVPAGSYYYLGILAVEPDSQGKGVGKRMLKYIDHLSKSNDQSEGVCLNTETQENVDIYRSQGYETVASAPIATFTSWSMLKLT